MLAKMTSWDNGDAEQAYSLPSRFFYDPRVFEAEKQGIFLKSWHVVGHESEIAEAGQYLRQDIFEQSVIAVRGQDGRIRAFHNVCQKRHAVGHALEGERLHDELVRPDLVERSVESGFEALARDHVAVRAP